ncbi:protein arginine N-methyltransferase [Gregarina niphandrodes]|uniref:type I protein arginine methyltransferase n=1 Tax=Gregarina niphandrodes TaxID=110365 RepID=A0A023BBJ4_GRENI|nr:protein arginine N-methyltransferase [Gregarina niphandrodes]EZG79493.1 protein arginine N-methyltransferase [Gregarina niphandrodes]|eukprot:XP_011134429.1 protein arginine N-methyltransferase [Gregarina niphandrodes]
MSGRPVHVVGGYVTEARAVADGDRSELRRVMEEPWESDGGRDLDYYFNSYSHLAIHEEMLKDRVRTSSYYNAITNNSHVFKDKVVLDVGAGTGVLSMFAAKAGAKHVYAVEYSDVAELARRLVKANGLEERVTVLQMKAEDLQLEPGSVDIIVSEWMGYFLLYESMLDCVLDCRDKFLKRDGLMLPDKARMFIAGLEDGDFRSEKFEFWNNVYGLDYSAVQERVLQEPLIDTVNADNVVTDACCIANFDLKTVQKKDLDFIARFQLNCNKQDYVHALVAWFDCSFDNGLHKPVTFSTAPQAQYTHWKQTVFYVRNSLPCKIQEQLTGIIAVKKGTPNPRTINVRIKLDFEGQVMQSHTDQVYYIR